MLVFLAGINMRHAANNMRLSALALGCVLSAVGCANTDGATKDDARVVLLESRLHESERMNGRLAVRIEELEDQMFLVHDRVEANRLALQRRGMMRGNLDQDLAQAPQRTPETYYQGGNNYEVEEPKSNRKAVRIPLSGYDPYQDPSSPIYGEGPGRQYQERAHQQEQVLANTRVTQEEPEMIINDDTLRRFAGSDHVSSSNPSHASSGSGRQAQPPVTSERLETSRESATTLEQPTTRAQRSASRDSLTLYKDSLSAYRGGKYADAYAGFQEFLKTNPSIDYVDNALYWLGECQFGLGNFDNAIGYFNRVLRETPDGNKVPDAMLKMSLAFERQGRADTAKDTLQKLVTQYPSSQAGQLGAQKLNENP